MAEREAQTCSTCGEVMPLFTKSATNYKQRRTNVECENCHGKDEGET